VATATEGMKMFEPYCFLCDTKEAYAEKIRYIINNRAVVNADAIKQRRKEFALMHTWEESIGMLGDAYFSVKSKTAL
jgi:glycosyltransferase involved in cell wall biosynthesis